MPTHSQPQGCINKRLLCPSLASTLRNPILPKAVSKRKYVGLDEPNFDEDVEKKPNAGQEYDPGGDYIYDARKYFNPEKYREIIAHQEEKKKKQQEAQNKFYCRPFQSQKRHYCSKKTDSGYSSVNYLDIRTERLNSPAASSLNSEDPICDTDKLLDKNSHPNSHHKKVKKKSKHSKHRSHTSASSHKHAKQKKSDIDSKKHKKKRKHKKSNNRKGTSLRHNYDNNSMSSDKRHRKLRHRSRHRSKLFSSQEPSATVTEVTNCDYSSGCHYLHQNSVGNDHGNYSDADCLPDESVSGGLNCHRNRCVVNNTVSDCSDSEDNFSNYVERPVTACDVSDWDEDSSVSSECSADMNRNCSSSDDESNNVAFKQIT